MRWPSWTPPGPERAVLVGLSCGGLWGVQLAVDHPERVLGLVASTPAVPLAPGRPERKVYRFERAVRRDRRAGRSTTRHYWQQRLRGLPVSSSSSRCFTEPHSTKQIEDCVGWGMETDPGTLVDATYGLDRVRAAELRRGVRAGRAARCSWSTATRTRSCRTPAASALAEVTGGALVTIEGGGHCPHGRDPVVVNRLVARVRRLGACRPHRGPARGRGRCAGPSGRCTCRRRSASGHARRDVAIADELRRLHPDLQIDWLAQHPVTTVLAAHGRAHPPGVGLPRQRVGRRGERGGRARPARVPGDPADGRHARQQLHGLRRPGRGRAVRRRGSATRRGTSTTSCTRTPS